MRARWGISPPFQRTRDNFYVPISSWAAYRSPAVLLNEVNDVQGDVYDDMASCHRPRFCPYGTHLSRKAWAVTCVTAATYSTGCKIHLCWKSLEAEESWYPWDRWSPGLGWSNSEITGGLSAKPGPPAFPAGGAPSIVGVARQRLGDSERRNV